MDNFIAIAEAAKLYPQLGHERIRQLAAGGKIPARRENGNWVVDPVALGVYLAQPRRAGGRPRKSAPGDLLEQNMIASPPDPAMPGIIQGFNGHPLPDYLIAAAGGPDVIETMQIPAALVDKLSETPVPSPVLLGLDQPGGNMAPPDVPHFDPASPISEAAPGEWQRNDKGRCACPGCGHTRMSRHHYLNGRVRCPRCIIAGCQPGAPNCQNVPMEDLAGLDGDNPPVGED